jgi:hypothetical protein
MEVGQGPNWGCSAEEKKFEELSVSLPGWCKEDEWIATVRIARAIAEAVSRRLPNAAARVRAQVSSCGICGGQSGTWVGSLRVLQFPLPILIPPTATHWYNRPISGRRTK